MQKATTLFEEIDILFKPRGVAVVGVSDRPGNQGRFLLEAMSCCGFKGDVYAVNAREDLKGFKSYRKVSDIPGPVDHLIISVPAPAVIDVILDAGKKGVRSASMFTSGFSEWGTEEGKLLEEELIKVGKETGVRLIGPNCMGFYCPSTGLSFRPDLPMKDGAVGFVSQSGGVSITGIFTGADRGVGFSKVISYGNEADLGAPEFLDYFAEDPHTRVILLYIEGTRRGRLLFESLKRATAKKPVFMLKGGKTNAGLRAVSSHTGALAGAGTIWETVARQTGAVLVNDLDELIDCAQVTMMMPKPAGKRVGLLTISGGFGVFATDIVESHGFVMPEFSQDMRDALFRIFKNPGTSVRNPLDMAASFFQPKKYPELVKILTNNEAVDFYVTLLAIDYLTFRGAGGEKWSHVLVESLLTAYKELKKPNAFVFFQTGMNEARIKLEKMIIEAGYPIFPTVGRAMEAIQRMMKAYQVVGR